MYSLVRTHLFHQIKYCLLKYLHKPLQVQMRTPSVWVSGVDSSKSKVSSCRPPSNSHTRFDESENKNKNRGLSYGPLFVWKEGAIKEPLDRRSRLGGMLLYVHPMQSVFCNRPRGYRNALLC